MANSYCNSECQLCKQTIPEGKGFVAQPATFTKEGYGYYRDKGPVKEGALRIKYHGGATSHRKAFHEKCWEELIGNHFRTIQRSLNAD